MSDELQSVGKRGGGTRKPLVSLDAAAAGDAAAGVASRYVQVGGPDRGQVSPYSAVDTDFVLRYPALAEYMTQQVVGHATRLTSTVLVMCDDGVFKACVSDRERDVVSWMSAETWEGLWEHLEAALASGKAVWRAKKPYTPKRG